MNKNQPLISLIIPAYNVEDYICQCLNSALNQSYDNIEIVIIDDGSSDSTTKFIEQFASRDTRIQYIHQQHHGVMLTRQCAIERTHGAFLCFLDGDDYLPKDAIATLYRGLEHTNADIVCADIVRIGKNYAVKRSEKWDGIIEGDTLMRYLLTNQMEGYLVAKLYKRHLFENLIYPADISLAEDKFINIQIAAKNPRTYHIPDTVYYYIKRTGSISHHKFSIEYAIKYTQYIEHFLHTTENYKRYEAELAVMRIKFYLMHIRHLSNPDIRDLPFTHHIYIQLSQHQIAQMVERNIEIGDRMIIQLYKYKITTWIGKTLIILSRIQQSIIKRIFTLKSHLFHNKE